MKITLFRIIHTLLFRPNVVARHIKKRILFYGAGFLGGYANFPFLINISVNNICNLRCKMCDVGESQKSTFYYKNLIPEDKKVLNLNEWNRFLEQVEGFKPEIAISTTEPLLYRDIIPLVRLVKSKDLRCQVTTNGVKLKEMAEDIVKSGLDRINVSIDGPVGVHDVIRGKDGLFDEIVKGTRLIEDLKKQYGSENPALHAYYTISDHNYHCLSDTVVALENLSFKSITFQHLGFVNSEMAKVHNERFDGYPVTVSGCSGVAPQKIDIDCLRREIECLHKRENGISVYWYPRVKLNRLWNYYNEIEPLVKNKRCKVPWFFSQINCNGEVVPLARCFNLVMGDVTKEDFKKIWNNSKYRDFRKNLWRHKSFPACSKCCALYF